MTKIILIDDHKLFRTILANWLATRGFDILYEAANGKEFIEKLDEECLPDIVLVDINMPVMNGFETAEWIKQHYPDINILAISMYDTEMNIIKMLKCGAKGYLLKDSEPKEVEKAIKEIIKNGFYFTDLVNFKLMNAINETKIQQKKVNNLLELSEKEIELLKLFCTELNYKEIGETLKLSPRTVEGYRDDLFKKLNIHTRIGLVIFAIKNGVVNFS